MFAVLAGQVAGQVTGRVSVGTGGVQGNANSFVASSAISPDGRYVIFQSEASNLVGGDTNGHPDVFVRDRQTGTTERVSISTSGAQGNDFSADGSISADGRYAAFDSNANNLIAFPPGDTNSQRDVFVRDRQSGTTVRVSVDSSGAQSNGDSASPSISADGRYVAFYSAATNLVSGDTNSSMDVFVHDFQTGATERVSVDSGGGQGNAGSGLYGIAISSDGRYVAFDSFASNLVGGDTNGHNDVFVHDRQTGTTERVSVDSAGVQGNNDSGLYGVAISSDGRYAGFSSLAANLVAGDTNTHQDIFVRDRQNGTTERVSVDSSGAQGNGDSYGISFSADGRCVAFYSIASNLAGGDTNGTYDVFVHDRQSGTTQRVSVHSGGAQGNGGSQGTSISAEGRYIAFHSAATNLVDGDTNGYSDVFIHDRVASGFTSLCDPGVGGVIGCPCSNPPSGTGRGCDNSAATGGASLSAAGIAYLSVDSLVFTTSGEKPTATSIVLQGTTSPPAGIVYGQGVRCVGGTLKRLFTKAAVAGSITAPDFGHGDPTVSARSAAKGDTIQPGQSRWYLVYYRDPTVLGGCPASSTFNATQTGRIDWSL
jgi:Tol biopolymer transport system component